MIEALLKLAWSLVEESVKPRLQAAAKTIVTPVMAWFAGLRPLGRKVVLGTLVFCLVSGALLIFLAWSGSAARFASELTRAVVSPRHLSLSGSDHARAAQYTGVWRDLMLDRYDKQVSSMRAGKPIVFETTWTLAQKFLALDGGLAAGDDRIAALSYYSGQEVDPTCQCWREIYYHNQQQVYPLHVGLSAWIIVSLERASNSLQPEHLEFLRETQLSNGAWPVLLSAQKEQGSTFATPWAILALLNIQPKLTDKAARADVANRIREASNWLLNARQPHKLWTLYPEGTTSGAKRISLSNSGLSIVALHRALRTESGFIPKEETDLWKTRIAAADREFLRNVRPGIALDEADSFNDQLETISEGPQTDRVQLLVLPWVVMGTVEAYPSGSLGERMQAIRLLDDFSERLDDFDHELNKTDNQWRIPEMSMAVRYWSDDGYLKQ
jgi:hypothetical protein